MQALDQEVHVPLNQGLLLAQRFVGEGVGDEAAVARVVLSIGGNEAVDASGGAVVEGHVFGHGGVALAVAVDVFPGVGVGEGELVGGDADDVAVGCVELVAFVGELAGEVVEDVGDAGGGVGFGAGVGGEGVEVEVVY